MLNFLDYHYKFYEIQYRQGGGEIRTDDGGDTHRIRSEHLESTATADYYKIVEKYPHYLAVHENVFFLKF